MLESPETSSLPNERIAGLLRERIEAGAWGPGEALPATQEMSREYGVSSNTIMAAFRRLEAEGLIESRPRKGRFVLDRSQWISQSVRRSSMIVSLGVPAFDNNPMSAAWWTQIILAFQFQLARRGYSLNHVTLFEENPEKMADEFERHLELLGDQVAGVHLFATPRKRSLIARLRKAGLPWVTVNPHDVERPCNFVAAGNVSGGQQVADCFNKLGFERVLLISPPTGESFTLTDKVNGFIQGYLRAHRSAAGMEMGWCEGIDPESAREPVEDYVKRHGRPPEAIFASGDDLAIGAMRVLGELGYRVPQDVSVIGGTGSPFAEYVTPSLSVITQPMTAIGNAAADMLVDMVQDQVNMVACRYLPGELILRDSVLQAKG